MSATSGFANYLTRRHYGVPGITITMVLSVIGNLIATVIILVAGNRPLTLAAVIIAGVFSLLALYLLPRSEGRGFVTERERPERYEGLIVLVSKGTIDRHPMNQAAVHAIQYHADTTGSRGLKHCWLIATSGPDGSQPYAIELAKRCRELGVEPHIEKVDDWLGVQDTYDLVRQIYAEAESTTGLRSDQIISDFTGSSRPMSVGMALACGERRPLEYFYGGRPDVKSEPRKIEFRS